MIFSWWAISQLINKVTSLLHRHHSRHHKHHPLLPPLRSVSVPLPRLLPSVPCTHEQ